LHPKQVLYSPPNHRYEGEWGVKHSLFPTKTPYYRMMAIDDLDGMPDVRSAVHNVARIEIWKEAMPKSASPFPIPTAEEMMIPALDQLSEKQYQKLKKKVMNVREQFLKLVDEGTVTKDKWPEFLNVRLPIANQNKVHPPVYDTDSTKQKTEIAPVKGRLLNSTVNGVSVGIGGWIAHVPSTPRVINRTELRDVYISTATINERGLQVIDGSFFKPWPKTRDSKPRESTPVRMLSDYKGKSKQFKPDYRTQGRNVDPGNDYESIRDRFRKFSRTL
jgi:hypothetical protein